MSQFPADPNMDPFDELARLIDDTATPAPAPIVPQPIAAAAPEPSSDIDIQAAMEGRSPAPLVRAPAAPVSAPPLPVFDPTAPLDGAVAQEVAPQIAEDVATAPAAAPQWADGVQQVPTRGPLAHMAQSVAPTASAPTEESPLEAVFDMSALRAAFQQNADAPHEPIPTQPAYAEPVVASTHVEPIEAPVHAAYAEPVATPAPAFTPPPAADVPESEQAEIVIPPTEFAAPAPAPQLEASADAARESVPAPSMFDEMEAMMAAQASGQASMNVDAPIGLPEAGFDLDLEAELEAALMNELEQEIPPLRQLEPAVAPVAPLSAPTAAVYPEPRNGARRAMALAAALFLIGGGAAVGWTLLGETASSDAPVILAATGPVKIKPDDAGGKAIPNRDTALFKADARPHQDALRSGTEKPVEVAMAPLPNRVKTELKRALPPTARKVRTVVVKPDGTIVAGEEVVGTVAPRIVKPTVVEPAKKALSPKVVAPKVVAPKVEDAPVQKAGVEAGAAEPKTLSWGDEPKLRETTSATKAVAAPEAVAAKPKPKAAPQPKPVKVAKKHYGYVVQISSRRSPEAARRAFTKLQKRYASVLGGREAEFQKTEIAGKGTFYRVRVPANSKSAARSLCGSLKRAGGSCFVTR